MIFKTVKNYRRKVRTYAHGPRFLKAEMHTEQVLRETWWLLCIPLYQRTTIEKTTI